MSIATDEKDAIFGEPAWDIAQLYPAQGFWSEADYFDLTNRTNRLIEFSDGRVEVLSMPTMMHQDIMLFLYELLKAFVTPVKLGKVQVAGMPVRLKTGRYRQPDVLFILAKNAHRMHQQYWEGADLVMEVVSEDRQRDLEVKRLEYAHSGIPEYWIVDPVLGLITVLELAGDAYEVRGEFGHGTRAESALLPGFSVDVTAVFTPPTV